MAKIYLEKIYWNYNSNPEAMWNYYVGGQRANLDITAI